jgi:hypothetical protein
VTVLSARCSARARPIAARVHHRPHGARPGHDHDPDPAARKADELDWRAQPAHSHRTHPPAVDVDPSADQPTTPWLPQPDSRRPPAAPRQRGTRSLLSHGPDHGPRADRRLLLTWTKRRRGSSSRRDACKSSRVGVSRVGADARIGPTRGAWLSRERIPLRHGGRAVRESGAAGLGEPAHPVPEPVGAVGDVDAGRHAAIVQLV